MRLKQIVLIAFALILCIFASCTDEDDGEDIDLPSNGSIDLSAIYLIDSKTIPTNLGSNASVLHKYNVLTGIWTPLCTDPFCDHASDSDCLFAIPMAYGSIAIDGEWVYFVREFENVGYDRDTVTITRRMVLCGLSYMTNELRILYNLGESKWFLDDSESILISGSGDSIYVMVEYIDGYVYFYERESDKWMARRVNVNTKKVETMYESTGDTFYPYRPYIRTKDHLYFLGEEIFSGRLVPSLYRTDYWYNNRVDILEECKGPIFIIDDSGYMYTFDQPKDDNFAKRTLYRLSVDGGEHEALLEGMMPTDDVFISSWKIIGDYMYYLVREKEDERRVMFVEKRIGITGKEEKVEHYSTFRGEIWRVKFDGSVNDRIISGDNFDFMYDMTTVGQYLVVSCNEEKPDGSYGIADEKLVYDTIAEKWLEYK